ncbi:MAG: MFS transporter [Dehalococcoidales bacterium]|nr:MFS transporter [Dehalococcoidales bacterium]
MPDTNVERKRSPLRNLRTFRSLKNPVYRLLFGGMIGQMAGMNMQLMAASLLIYRVTGSATLLGLMALAFAGPLLLFSLFGGIIADRIHKKYVLLGGQLFSAVVSLSVALSLTMGYLSTEYGGSWWILIVAAVCQGTVMSLIMPSSQAILREIVGGEQLLNAVSLNTFAMNGFRILGPALAGFLIDALDFVAVYYLMTCLYLMSAIFISRMPLTGKTALAGESVLSDIKEGLNYVRHEITILVILLFSLFSVVLAMPYVHLMPVFIEDILQVGASEMGVLMSASGIGAIIGSLILASLPNKKRGLLLVISSLCSGIALVGFAFSRSWYLSLLLIAFVGLGQSGRLALSNTLLQYYSKAEYRGRVMSIFMMEIGLMSFGAFGAALLTEAIGVQSAIGGFAVVLAFLSILTLAFVPRLRRLN